MSSNQNVRSRQGTRGKSGRRPWRAVRQGVGRDFGPNTAARQLRAAALTLVAAGALVQCGAGDKTGYAASCAGCNDLLGSGETRRADRLGVYGYPRPTSPWLDQFAADAVVFERASSVSYHTAESHMSLFTSVFPSVHGVANASSDKVDVLPPAIGTLAEAFRDAGYRTAGFHGGGNVAAAFGFDRGFEDYQETHTVDRAREWIESAGRDAPWFLFFHTHQVHDPYIPEAETRHLFKTAAELPIPDSPEQLERLLAEEHGEDATPPFTAVRDAFWRRVDPSRSEHVQRVSDLYDSKVRELDAMLESLVEVALRTARPTLVVITSDHGEEFQEHGRFLHDALYEELLHVPLILRHPELSAAPRRVTDRVSLIDLAPTLLELVGAPPLVAAQGRSLAPFLSSGGADGRALLAEKVHVQPSGEHRYAGAQALYLEPFKLIARGSELELYRLESEESRRPNLV